MNKDEIDEDVQVKEKKPFSFSGKNKGGRPPGSKNKKGVMIKIPKYDMREPVSTVEAVKERCKTDLFFLATEILGYKYVEEERRGITGKDLCHVRMLDIINSPERFKLILVFRGSYKTTLMVCKMIQILISDPEATILYVTDSWNYSRKVLREAKQHLCFNEKLISLFGQFEPDKKIKQIKGRQYLWNRDNIDVAQRDIMTKQPSISTAGADSEVTGQHPTWIILDDIVGPKNITTVDQRQKVIDYVNQCIPILGSSGKLIMVGTPWAYDDAYDYVVRNWLGKKDADGKTPLFSFMRLGILQDGEPTMPYVYGHSEIEQLRSVTPAFQWACQYLCDPIAEGNTLFAHKDIEEYTRLTYLPSDDYEVWITIDPAISLDPKRCWTGIVAGIPIPPYYLYIDEAQRLKVLPQDLIAKVLDLINQYQGRVRAVGIEEQSFQKIYSGSLINELRKRMLEHPETKRVSVIPLKPNDNKHRRIYALEPYFRHHQIKIRRGLDDMLFQLHHYPHLSEHNLDLLDSLAYQLQILPTEVLRSPYGIIEVEQRIQRVPGAFYDEDLVEDRRISW